jgi:hypothetical protein
MRNIFKAKFHPKNFGSNIRPMVTDVEIVRVEDEPA